MTVDDCVQIIEAQRVLLDARESHITELVRQMSVLWSIAAGFSILEG